LGIRQQQANRLDPAAGLGDVWTFIALDADTKLITSFVVGKREVYHTKMFMDDLAGRLKNKVQLSSDGMSA
jgi:hypothetical protein